MRHRVVTVPGRVCEMRVLPVGEVPPGWSDPIAYPPIIRYGNVPSYDELVEMADDVVTGWGSWNPFFHYKKECKIGSLGSSQIPHALDAGAGQGTWWEETPTGIKERHYHLEQRIPVELLYNNTYGLIENGNTGLDSFIAYNTSGKPYLVLPPDHEERLGAAVKRLLPTIHEEVGLVNALIELKDVRSLAKTGRLLGQSMQKFAYFLDRMKLQAGSVKLTRRMVSDLTLQYNFNVKPLIGDIRGFLKSAVASQRKIRRLLSQMEAPRTKHTSRGLPTFSLNEKSDQTVVYSYGYYLSPDVTIFGRRTREVREEAPKFHVEIRYTYQYSDFQRRHADLLAFLDANGIPKVPKIIWNASKWTFIIDWVLGISELLDRLCRSAMEPSIVIHQALFSYTRRRTIRLGVELLDGAAYRCSDITETGYSRSLFTPHNDWIKSSGLNSYEVMLASALVGSRR